MDYTISEQYVLPSLAKIYDVEFDPHITLRSMTTVEEMKRLAPSEFTYRNMCEIIDDCIIEDLPISCYDMCIGDYQYLLHKLRSVTYGSKYPVVHKCMYCGCTGEEQIDLSEFEVKTYTEDCEKYLSITLPTTKHEVKLNIQTPHMLDKVQQDVKDYRKRTKGKSEYDSTIVYLICSLLKQVDGKVPNPINLESWVKKLPMMDVNTILAYADKFNQSIGVDTSLTFICDVCQLEQKTMFVPDKEFFRPRLDI